jgi:hypothetical protein
MCAQCALNVRAFAVARAVQLSLAISTSPTIPATISRDHHGNHELLGKAPYDRAFSGAARVVREPRRSGALLPSPNCVFQVPDNGRPENHTNLHAQTILIPSGSTGGDQSSGGAGGSSARNDGASGAVAGGVSGTSGGSAGHGGAGTNSKSSGCRCTADARNVERGQGAAFFLLGLGALGLVNRQRRPR